jgi:hypothetical protein
MLRATHGLISTTFLCHDDAAPDRLRGVDLATATAVT